LHNGKEASLLREGRDIEEELEELAKHVKARTAQDHLLEVVAGRRQRQQQRQQVTNIMPLIRSHTLPLFEDEPSSLHGMGWEPFRAASQ
jgi:hypothetical protein